MVSWYILNEEGEVVPSTMEEFLSWTEKEKLANKIIVQDELEYDDNLFLVSTVFLGLDHKLREDGDPIVFETMVFRVYGDDRTIDWGGEYDVRYTSLENALQGHFNIVSLAIKKGFNATYTNKGPIIQRMEDKHGRSLLPTTASVPRKIENK